MSTVFRLASVALLLVPRLHSRLPSANAFVLPTPTVAAALPRASRPAIRAAPLKKRAVLSAKSSEDDSVAPSPSLDESKSTLLGVAGIVAASIMGYSEAVLFRTGCGLPAGPLGLVGAAEGVSYLGVVGLVGFSVYTKIRTGSGLPSGPSGVLGAAEGLSYLVLTAGAVVLLSQVTNYGYIPNAVPMEGGMCS